MISCPIPLDRYPRVLMAHGGGGRLMHQLIEEMIIPAFQQTQCESHDAAVLPFSSDKLAFTSDSFVVSPLFFPGGDIGSLAIHGTINDLCMSGAKPLYLSVSFILEEGLEMSVLWKIIQSMANTSKQLGVPIVTGDTKVVEKNHGDGIYINTSGIGVIEHGLTIGPSAIRENDVVIVNGDLGRHGLAIMTAREGIKLDAEIQSDSAPLINPVARLIEAGIEVHCMRDITRGGLAAVINELVVSNTAPSLIDIIIEEGLLPVDERVQSVCEILGLDVLNIACEGRFVLIIPEDQQEAALDIIRNTPLRDKDAETESNEYQSAQVIGKVSKGQGQALRKNTFGVTRPIEFPLGELLPRIC